MWAKEHYQKEVFKEYANNDLIGAVAYISVKLESDKFAIKNWLFVIKATGESVRIINKKDSRPKIW